jgi:hypothetical protein
LTVACCLSSHRLPHLTIAFLYDYKYNGEKAKGKPDENGQQSTANS